MADIAMCRGENGDGLETAKVVCPMRERCYRHIATPNTEWQSYLAGFPQWGEECPFFWPIAGTWVPPEIRA